MTLDVRTLIVLMAVGHLLQIVVLSLQYVVFRSYRGIGGWVLSSAWHCVFSSQQNTTAFSGGDR